MLEFPSAAARVTTSCLGSRVRPRPTWVLILPIVGCVAVGGCFGGSSATTPVAVPAPEPVHVTTAADQINYFLAVQKWLVVQQERRISETVDRHQAVASLRGLLREMREQAFDAGSMPGDFRQSFLRNLASADETLEFVEELPNFENPWSLIGLSLNLGKDYVLGGKDSLTVYREKVERLAAQNRQVTQEMDAIAIQHGARTDWDAMPRVLRVEPNGRAATMGIQPGDFYFTYDGTKLFRRLNVDAARRAVSDGKSQVPIQFLTRRGIVSSMHQVSAPIGIETDTSCAEPPVVVRLDSYLVSAGYYVLVSNLSPEVTLTDVSVRYVDTGGRERSQVVGSIGPGSSVRLDPDAVHWRIEKGEQIVVSAAGFVERRLNASALIR